jgi:hypothetical protein
VPACGKILGIPRQLKVKTDILQYSPRGVTAWRTVFTENETTYIFMRSHKKDEFKAVQKCVQFSLYTQNFCLALARFRRRTFHVRKLIKLSMTQVPETELDVWVKLNCTCQNTKLYQKFQCYKLLIYHYHAIMYRPTLKNYDSAHEKHGVD